MYTFQEYIYLRANNSWYNKEGLLLAGGAAGHMVLSFQLNLQSNENI